MRGNRCRVFARAPNWTWRIWFVATVTWVVTAFSAIVFAPSAQALPSFARQTGQPCGACHTDFAGLTPFGRRFKIGGYTSGGGPYRTTIFPEDPDASDKKKIWVPPISMMAIVGFTHTQVPLPQPTAPYHANDNVVASPLSFFWGGAITDHIGAFAQVTYNAPGPGGFGSDPFAAKTWTWDNTDIRFADSTAIGWFNITYGITANNNPTVQDPWNTTPAWAFPYAASTIAPKPASAAIIDGAFAAHVGSVGAYAYLNDTLYLEFSAYRTLDFNAQNDLGTDPFLAPGLFDFAPYWRIAFEPHWGNNWLEIGTFGMAVDVHPWLLPGTTNTTTFTQTDKYTDIGIDSQYQYQGDNFWFTARGTYIREYQRLDASFPSGLTSNLNNTLNEARAYMSLAYGNKNRLVFTGQYFNTWGSSDPLLYAGLASGFSPNSNGWIAEVAYIPFVNKQAPGWPWFNSRIGLQYVYYDKFDGTTVGAKNNNTLFLYAWVAM